jgi:hypothetical protein
MWANLPEVPIKTRADENGPADTWALDVRELIHADGDSVVYRWSNEMVVVLARTVREVKVERGNRLVKERKVQLHFVSEFYEGPPEAD